MATGVTGGNRLDWVDSAKGISIILVVMLYAAYTTGEATGGTGFLHIIVGFATPFRMPEFYLISGLFLSQVINRDWRRYLDRRFVHYLYFYGLWALILIVFKVAIFAGDPVRALSWIAWAIVEPFSMLWFIYVLAFLSLAVKVAHAARIPHWAMLIGAATLQIAPVATPFYAVNQFAEYLIYFYSGYVFAPMIFKLVAYFFDRPALTIATLATWAGVNGMLVFLPGFSANPGSFDMGLAALPGLHLALALAGAIAVCLLAALFAQVRFMAWLSWLGAHSIVIFLAFSIPMAVTREVLIRFNLISDTGIISALALLSAIVAPVVLYGLVQWTGWGKFLFERPGWARIAGTEGSTWGTGQAIKVPAE
ncbi:MAG: acyltransferase family protein [Alphaproteobacteria bacterium]|nr:acyltransferase family protein [Alphaproteobacteria bacterium]